MAVTITATKYFTGTGPIKFSEIRDTFGDLPGSNVRLSDYKRNSTGDIDWNEDSTISPLVPDATENAELSDADDNIQISDYRNTIKQYDVEQTGNEEERVYSDGNTTDWNNNLSKNINKNYNVTGTIYANEVDKYALTFEEGNYNNLYINVSGNIYGEGGSAGDIFWPGGDGGGALYLNNKYDGDKVRLSITNNGKIWAGGGGGSAGSDGNDGNTISCQRPKTWTADNKVGNTHLCNGNSGACNKPLAVCKKLSGLHNDQTTGPYYNNSNMPNDIIENNVSWNSASPNGGNRGRCRGPRGGTGARGGIDNNTVINYADRNNTYQCTTSWTMQCSGEQQFNKAGGTKGTKGNAGAGKGWSNRNTAINSSPHIGNDGNDGNCSTCPNTNTSSCGNDGNPGTDGGDWGQNAHMGGSAGIAIRKKKVIINNANPNNVKGPINNI